MSASIIDATLKKRKSVISELEKDSSKRKKKKKSSRSGTESDVESIIDDEYDRNSVMSSSTRKTMKEKPWNRGDSTASTNDSKETDYDIVISDDLRLSEDDIPPLSVYIGAGFAAEIKPWRKSFYLSFSKKDLDTQRKKFINVHISQLKNVLTGLNVIDKHVKKYTE